MRYSKLLHIFRNVFFFKSIETNLTRHSCVQTHFLSFWKFESSTLQIPRNKTEDLQQWSTTLRFEFTAHLTKRWYNFLLLEKTLFLKLHNKVYCHEKNRYRLQTWKAQNTSSLCLIATLSKDLFMIFENIFSKKSWCKKGLDGLQWLIGSVKMRPTSVLLQSSCSTATWKRSEEAVFPKRLSSEEHKITFACFVKHKSISVGNVI